MGTLNRLAFVAAAAAVALAPVPSAVAAAPSVQVTVPGTSNPWLSGMPPGTLSDFSDSAPDQSPVEVVGLDLAPGGVLAFRASGRVDHDPMLPLSGPDGRGFGGIEHNAGAEHGISNTRAPFNSLLGVFLGPDRPDLTPAPPALDFGSETARGYRSLGPQLKQVFFIGDGLSPDGQQQAVTVPDGATRLFLGTMDSTGWHNNIGSFTVEVVPEPAAAALMLPALGALLRRSRRR